MADIFPSTQSGDKLKSYWNRPGGKFGTVIGLAGLGVAAWYLLPILTTLAWDFTQCAIAGAIAFLTYMVLSNKKLWMSIFYLYEILMKKLVGVVIQLDPFIIAEDYISDIKKEREMLYNKTIEVNGQKEAIIAKIKEKNGLIQKEKDKAISAQRSGGTDAGMAIAACSRQIARLEQYVQQLTPIQISLTKVGDYLDKVYKNSAFMLDDMQADLDLKKDLYKSVTKGNNALKSAMAIFNGDAEKKMMVEQSMDYLKDDIATKLASMKQAINISSDFMKNIDLENGAYEVEGLRMLEEYKPEMFTHKSETGELVTIPSLQSVGTTNLSQYDKLL